MNLRPPQPMGAQRRRLGWIAPLNQKPLLFTRLLGRCQRLLRDVDCELGVALGAERL